MPEGWLIELPAWGAHYVDLAVDFTIPALKMALERTAEPVRFLVHTDAQERIGKALEGYPVEFRRINPLGGFQALISAHNEAMQRALLNEKVALLNADIIVSVESFEVADTVLESRSAIATVGMRTVLAEGVEPPIGADARTLNAWCWSNRHPITEESVWGRGHTRLPTVLIWDDGAGNVVMRCFHLCPIMICKRRHDFAYRGTIDDGLLKNFSDEQVFFVTRHEMAFAEVSPAKKDFGIGQPLSVDGVKQLLHPFHRHHLRNFEQRIAVIGDPDVVNDAEAAPIMASLAHLPLSAKEKHMAARRLWQQRMKKRA